MKKSTKDISTPLLYTQASLISPKPPTSTPVLMTENHELLMNVLAKFCEEFRNLLSYGQPKMILKMAQNWYNNTDQ